RRHRRRGARGGSSVRVALPLGGRALWNASLRLGNSPRGSELPPLYATARCPAPPLRECDRGLLLPAVDACLPAQSLLADAPRRSSLGRDGERTPPRRGRHAEAAHP